MILVGLVHVRKIAKQNTKEKNDFTFKKGQGIMTYSSKQSLTQINILQPDQINNTVDFKYRQFYVDSDQAIKLQAFLYSERVAYPVLTTSYLRRKRMLLLIMFLLMLIIIYQGMLKHKLIIKEFKYRERIRRSYGLQRLKTTYSTEDSPQNQQHVQEISEESIQSSNQEFFCFQGNFLDCQVEEPTCDYNPYDLFINEANNQLYTPQPSKIAALNAAFLASMKIDDQTSPVTQKLVSFDREVHVIYFDAESPINAGHSRQETCNISWN